MLVLALALLFQTQTLKTGTASDLATPQVYRIAGKVVVGLDQPVVATITLRPIVSGAAGTSVAQSAQSFANGTFRFDGVQLGTYTLEVTDSHYNLFNETLLLRDPADTGKDLLIRLTRLGESGNPPSPDVDLYTIDAETKSKTPAKAMAKI